MYRTITVDYYSVRRVRYIGFRMQSYYRCNFSRACMPLVFDCWSNWYNRSCMSDQLVFGSLSLFRKSLIFFREREGTKRLREFRGVSHEPRATYVRRGRFCFNFSHAYTIHASGHTVRYAWWYPSSAALASQTHYSYLNEFPFDLSRAHSAAVKIPIFSRSLPPHLLFNYFTMLPSFCKLTASSKTPELRNQVSEFAVATIFGEMNYVIIQPYMPLDTPNNREIFINLTKRETLISLILDSEKWEVNVSVYEHF